jgi:actin-related protein
MEDVLFFPRKLGFESRSLSEQISFILREVPIDLRKTLSQNIVISGGNGNILNLKERIGN